jgi:hypothetical protein
MGMMFVAALPCIGVVMIFIWAFTGENETRKNYFRAILMWFALGLVLFAILAALGELSQLQQQFKDALPKKL